jgi:hypothetical protein
MMPPNPVTADTRTDAEASGAWNRADHFRALRRRLLAAPAGSLPCTASVSGWSFVSRPPCGTVATPRSAGAPGWPGSQRQAGRGRIGHPRCADAGTAMGGTSDTSRARDGRRTPNLRGPGLLGPVRAPPIFANRWALGVSWCRSKIGPETIWLYSRCW